MTNFPLYKQSDSKDCGPTCLRIIVTFESIIQRPKCNIIWWDVHNKDLVQSQAMNFFKQKKSLFGTMTMFLTSLLVVCSIGYAQQNSLNLNYFTIAFFATLLEQFSVLGIDNFIVPISSAIFFNFFITS